MGGGSSLSEILGKFHSELEYRAHAHDRSIKTSRDLGTGRMRGGDAKLIEGAPMKVTLVSSILRITAIASRNGNVSPARRQEAMGCPRDNHASFHCFPVNRSQVVVHHLPVMPGHQMMHHHFQAGAKLTNEALPAAR